MIVPPGAMAVTSRRPDRAVAGLLRACVRGDAWRAGSADWHHARELARRLVTRPGLLDELPAAARFHGVAGYAHRVLAGLDGATGAVSGELEALRAGGLHNHLRIVSDLPLLDEVLGGAGVPWLVVKGPVLAELHGAADLRAYSDLDLVVPAVCFGDALEALERAGARLLASNWSHRLEVLAGEVPLVLPSGTAVDLHWHVLNEHPLRQAFRLRMPPLFARARTAEILGRTVRTLDDPDLLLHLALHTAMSGANRLVWLKDVERILARASPDPVAVRQRAAEAGLELVVVTVLDRIAVTLNLPDLASLVGGLEASRSWRAVAMLARRIRPPERATPGGSVDRLVSRATRTDLRSSTAELTRRAANWGLRGQSDGEARRSDRGAGDGGEARRAFLAAVARAADL